MGHYFWKIEKSVDMHDMNIKIEVLPPSLINEMYRKGWVYQRVTMDDKENVFVNPNNCYPIFIQAGVKEFVELFEKHKQSILDYWGENETPCNSDQFWEMIDSIHEFTTEETITIEVS